APNGQLIVELVPELELLIGRQPPVQELGPKESQQRFELLFQNFLHVLSGPEQPLALFLDDLQWADASSLRLLTLALTSRRRAHLLIVGAYRENEIGPGHPLTGALVEIAAAGAFKCELRLGPLELAHVTRMLEDTLGADPVRVGPLAAFLLAKTLGSP